MLKQVRLKELLNYDKYTGIFTWATGGKGKSKGAIAGTNDNGYVRIKLDHKQYLAHRLAWLYEYGYIPLYVDHDDRIRNHNWITNLRDGFSIINARNLPVDPRNASGCTGVKSTNNRNKKWHATIALNSTHKALINTSDFIEAVAHRLAAEQCLDWPNSNSSASKIIKEYITMPTSTGCMLCYPLEESRLIKWNVDYYIVQEKLDGVRSRVILEANNIQLISRGERMQNFAVPHIVKQLNELIPLFTSAGIYELDCELYTHGMSFEEINAIASRDVNLHEKAEELNLVIFDHIVPNADNMARLQDLWAIREHLADYPNILISNSYRAPNLAVTLDYFKSFLENGYEGIIVRNPTAEYTRKRSTNIMKFKPKQHDIYTIINVKEEISKDGIPKDRLGAIECVSDEGTTFWVSAGLNDEMRNDLWQTDIIGKKVKVYYQAVTKYGVPKFAFDLEVID